MELRIKPHLLPISNEHAEPGTDFAVGTQQETADVRDEGTDRLIWSIWSVVQSQSHSQARQVALLHLEIHTVNYIIILVNDSQGLRFV